MAKTPAFKLDLPGNLGKNLFKRFMKLAGEVEPHKPGIQEQRTLRSIDELAAYLDEQYLMYSRALAEDKYPALQGKSIEEVMLERALPRWRLHPILDIGMLMSFESGDFTHLYRSLIFYLKYYYASDIYLELVRGRGYAYGCGTDHGTYHDAVIASFAVMRPDFARRFYPEELGPITRSHATLNRLGSLVAALLPGNDGWKEKAVKDARKYLQSKRQTSERAALSYMLNLCEANAEGMSEDLQTLMDNYRKAGWFMLGDACAVALYGYYLMGSFYLDKDTFKKVRRPSGPGWWDQYLDLCLPDPLPAALDEPFAVFTGNLVFINKAVDAINLDPPAGSLRLSLDIKPDQPS